MNAISLFSGAGGMDVGFENAGYNVVWANEIDKYAAETFKNNHPYTELKVGDLNNYLQDLKFYNGEIDIVFGGPPCQGFSVAGKMDPKDKRNELIWTFMEVVKIVKPKAFVMENVKALGTLEKWSEVREEIIKLSNEAGYDCKMIILNAAKYGIPQKRERVFFIGFHNKNISHQKFSERFIKYEKPEKTVKEAIHHLGPAGSKQNPNTCAAKITLATNPILRKSPYAGMLFNGMGRPLNLNSASTTLPASMGGNKTPIIDEELLHGNSKTNWVEEYHQSLSSENSKPYNPSFENRLRRLTLKEAAVLQTFPEDYIFAGSKSTVYKQIGNAVPCELAEVVAKVVKEELLEKNNEMHVQEYDNVSQLKFDLNLV